jgi:plastocyanin
MHRTRLVALVAAPTWIQWYKEVGMRKISGLLGALILALGVVSCGGGGSTTGTGGGGGGGGGGGNCPTATFCMTAGAFTPTTLTATAGSTVTWQNASGTLHNVVWDDATARAAAAAGDGAGDFGSFPDATTHTRLFAAAGTYGFHCTLHIGMTGTLTVQ